MKLYSGLIAALAISLLTTTASALPEHKPALEHKKTRIVATQSQPTSSIAITEGWARPSNTGTGAAFMKIKNNGKEAINIISATSDIAENVEIHGHNMDDNGVMRMYKLDKLTIKAGETAILEPGENHIMFFNLKNPLKSGDKFNVTAKLDNGAEIIAAITVKADE